MPETRGALMPGGLYAQSVGSGAPLVLLHGWCLSGMVWHGLQQLLAEHWQSIALDLPGHGRSPGLAAGYELTGLATAVAAAIEGLGLTRPPVLLGWSLGGMVALQLAAARLPLAGLVLVGTTPRFTVTADFSWGLPADQPRGMAAKVRRDYQRCLAGFFGDLFTPGELQAGGLERLAAEVALLQRLPEQSVALATLATLATADLRGELSAVDCPVMVIHGEEDRVCLPCAGRYLAEQLPGAELQLLAGRGHAPFLSHPAEFNHRLTPFLERCHG